MKKNLIYFMIINIAICEKIYNYYELAAQKWCSDTYMIHGLWPQTDENHYPSYCEDVEYIFPDDNILESMQQMWKGCDDELWSHEWKKHGSCMKKQINITENDFFNITLQLFDSHRFLLETNCDLENENCIMGCFDLDYNLMLNC